MAAVRHDKLTYVNKVLGAVGMGPVATLGQTRTATQAEDTLDQVEEEVQSGGWHFNTDRDVKIAPDGSDNIIVPTDALRIDPEDPAKDFVEVGGKMFDLENNTSTITATLKYRIVRRRTFTDLPSAAQDYIAARASRVFQDRIVGSRDAAQRLASDEARALATLTLAESQNAEANALYHSFSVSRARGGPRVNPLLEY